MEQKKKTKRVAQTQFCKKKERRTNLRTKIYITLEKRGGGLKASQNYIAKGTVGRKGKRNSRIHRSVRGNPW